MRLLIVRPWPVAYVMVPLRTWLRIRIHIADFRATPAPKCSLCVKECSFDLFSANADGLDSHEIRLQSGWFRRRSGRSHFFDQRGCGC